MKKLSKTVAKGLLGITLFTGISMALSTSGFKTINEAHAAVNSTQVNNYLVGNGYTVISSAPINGSNYRTEDWTAHTVLGELHFTTTIHVSGSNIIGHEDVLL